MGRLYRIIRRSKIFLPLTLMLGIVTLSTIVQFVIERHRGSGIDNLFDSLWWSIVTISTTGYGDIVPTSILGKIFALLIIIFGVLLISLITGTIASWYLSNISRSRSGHMEFKNIKNHIVICGWRHDMADLLKKIMKSDQQILSKLVVIADAPQENIDELFETSALEDFKFIRGHIYDKEVLTKANIKHAKKAIVLADQTKVRTPFEVDSQTVMTVISLKTLNKNLYVTAQILEKNFEVYLQRAKCDELVYVRDFSTKVLSLIINQSGMGNVLESLIGADEKGCSLRIEPIKSNLYNKSFGELRNFVNRINKHAMLIGILENTGNQKQVTELAIKEAQHTANFPQMLDRLRQVHNIKSNNPVLLPSIDYEIKPHSSYIILERS